MKKFIIVLMACFLCSGCSLFPRLTFDTSNTVPQSVDRSKIKDVCRGTVVMNDVGEIVSCSKGYMSYAENYVKQERKMTFAERIKSFINKLVGFGFWGLLLLVILVPSLAGTIIGRMIEGTFGIGKKALVATVRGVQNARKSSKDLNDSLASEQDLNVKQYIAKLKQKENIK